MALRKGFTLVETLVVVALTGLVGVGLLSMIAYFYRSNAYILESASANESARRGFNESLASLREASYAADGAYPVAGAGTSTVTFYADLDADTAVERVRLFVENGTLYRAVTKAAGNPPSYGGQTEQRVALATWVKNPAASPVFRYVDAAGAELAAPIDVARVRAVRIRLEVDVNPLRAPEIVVLEGAATLRNVRTR